MIAIDISYWQHSPNFAQVKAAGVGLVIMKMGGAEPGRLYFDSVYVANRIAARAVGLAVGSYFFNGAVNPTDAANFQMNNVDWRPGDIVALDVESATGVTRWNAAQVLAWCKAVIARGVPAGRVLVYMSSSVTRAENWSAVAALGVGLWVAQYGSNSGSPEGTPSIAYWASWVLWQYTSKKTWPGIVGLVDTNIVANSWIAGGGTPIVSDVKTIEEDEMPKLYHRTTVDTTPLNGMVAIMGPGFFTHIGSQADVAALTSDFGAPIEVDATGFVLRVAAYHIPIGVVAPGNRWSQEEANAAPAPAITLTAAQLDSIAAAVHVPPADVSAVLTAIAALDIPTAAENGAAARTAIVK